MGALAPIIGAGAVIGGIASAFRGRSAPPAITPVTNDRLISSQYQPINFTQIMDELTGDNLQIVRDVDNRVSLNFTNNGRRINLTDPNNLNLPPVRQIRGRAIDEQAAEVIALSAAMTRLGEAIETMEATSPYLIPQNQELINNYKTAVSGALDRGFDFKQQSIDKRLAKMGLSNSSTAIGVQIALARDKATAYAESELKQAELAQSLKQQSLNNLNQRGALLNSQANLSLDRYRAETSNQLQLRSQDMQADMAAQALEQQRAIEQNNILDRRRAMMLQSATDVFNTQNQNALNARQIDNSAISGADQMQLAAFNSRPREGFSEIGNAALGQFIGTGIGQLTDSIFQNNNTNVRRQISGNRNRQNNVFGNNTNYPWNR